MADSRTGCSSHVTFQTMVTEGQEQQEHVYGSTLDADTLEMARLELREDDSAREQALEQFRDWIQKHPTIKRCRTDSLFLLRFLRTKKFSLPMAQEMLERYLTIRQLYPDWFQKLDIDDPDLEAIIDSGYLVPLLKRDQHGRKVILSCAGNDPWSTEIRGQVQGLTGMKIKWRAKDWKILHKTLAWKSIYRSIFVVSRANLFFV